MQLDVSMYLDFYRSREQTIKLRLGEYIQGVSLSHQIHNYTR